jgi:hypothetical protein
MSWVFGPGGGGTPGGADQDIQFNNNGSFSGSNLLTTDGSGSLSASTHVSASTFYGDGSNLTGVTASAVQVADGPQYSLQFRYDSPVSGDLSGSANFVVSSDMSTLSITGSTILSGALSSSNIVPLADEQYDIGQEGLGYENAYINFLNGGVAFTVQNDEGATISKGDVVYIKGISGGNPTVGLAACDDAAKMPAFGFVADGNIPQGSTGRVVTLGRLNGIDTTAFSAGDILYVQTGSGGTSGSVTNTPPTGSGNLLQNIGKVTEASGSGQIRVGGAGRTNATPNLDKGHIFVGNETDQAIQDSTIFVSASAERVGINVSTNLTAALHVSASSVHGGESARFEGLVVVTSPDGELIVQDTDSNKQIRATAATFPSLEFGNSVDDTSEYFYLQGGATSKIIVKSNLNAFIISDTTAGTEGITYKPTQARVGINTPLPTHAFTVNGDTAITGALNVISDSTAGSITLSGSVSGQQQSKVIFGDNENSKLERVHDSGDELLRLTSEDALIDISGSHDGGVNIYGGDGAFAGFLVHGANGLTVVNPVGGVPTVAVSLGQNGTISASANVSASALYAEDAYVSSIPADRVLVSTTNGQITSHSPFTFSSDVLSVPTITASVGIQTEALETTSSANGSISIGEGIIYTYEGLDRIDAFEDTFKLRDVNYYKAVSTVQTLNFNIEGFQTFLVDTTGSVITGTLPGLTSDGQIGLTYTIKDYAGSGSTNNVVIEPSGSQEIDGGTAAKIQTNYGAMTLTAFSSSHGYSWGIVSAT